MTTNTTDLVFNSTQPGLSSVCSLMGIYAWQQQYLTPTTLIMFVFTASVEALICPFTILLNALVILAVKQKRYLRKQKHCVLLACLTSTDFVVGVVVLPLTMTSHILRVLGVGPICLVDKIAINTAMYVVCGASFYHLVIISGERYVAIKHALRYETLVTTRRLTIAVVAAWAYAVICTILASDLIIRDVRLLGTISFIILLSGVLAVSFFQVAVLLESKRHRKHIQAHQVSDSIAKKVLKENKAVKTTTIILVTMFICFAPQVVWFGVTTNVSNFPASLFISGTLVLDVFVYCNSVINPIIYCVRTQEFQRAFKELFNLEASHINNFAINKVGRSRGQRRDSNTHIDSSHKKKQMDWSDPSPPRGSRSRSLDLSKNSTHNLRKNRRNSAAY